MAPRKWSFTLPRCRIRSLLLTLVGASLLLLAGFLAGVDVMLGFTVVPVLVPEDSSRLVDTPGCVIPGFSIYDHTVAQLISPRRKLHCSSLPPLTVSPGASVSLNWSALTQYKVSSDGVRCCAQTVTRLKQDRLKYDLNADNLHELSSCTPFSGEGQYRPPSPAEAAVVHCRDVTALLPGPFYSNVHYFMPRDKVAQKIQAFAATGGWAANPDRVNVIVFGTDSVSRLNLERHSPKTLRWLKDHPDHLDFLGFNKVADNTDPNLLALMLGLDPVYTDKIPCHDRYGAVWDDCPFLWKQFSKQGYVTVLGEDAPVYGIFHYAKAAYIDQPTDFYNRPGFMASERTIAFPDGPYSFYFRNCQGPTPSIKVIHDYALKSLRTFHDVPVFGLFWSASTSHERLNDVSTADDLQVEFLSNLKRFGHLNNTVVFFMSDHGLRFGEIRSTYIGSLEERLPYMFMLVPPWFKERYSDLMKNLQVNQERLVTSFDFHHTMKDFLHQNFQGSLGETSDILDVRLSIKSPLQGNEDASNQFNQGRNYSRYETGNLDDDRQEGWNFQEEELDMKGNTNASLGHSLFEVVSPYRTCRDVMIPDHFCTCLSTAEIDTNGQLAVDAAHYVINEINLAVQNFSVCHPWRLKKVLLARSGGYSTSALTNRTRLGPLDGGGKRTEAVLITISAAPGDARFEATLVRTPLGAFHLTAEISRISRYDGFDSEEEGEKVAGDGKDFEDGSGREGSNKVDVNNNVEVGNYGYVINDADVRSTDNGVGGDGDVSSQDGKDEVNNQMLHALGSSYKGTAASQNTSTAFKRRRSRITGYSVNSDEEGGKGALSFRGRRGAGEEVEPFTPEDPEHNDLRNLEDAQRERKYLVNLLEDHRTVAKKNKQGCAEVYKGNPEFAGIRKYCYC